MLIEWIHCPICGGKTRNKIRGDTEFHSVHAGEDDVADNNEREPDRDEQSGIHCGESRVGGKDCINEPLEAAGLIDAGGQGHREAELDECRPGKVRADILEGADADAGAEHQEDGDKNDVVGSNMVDAVGAECKQSQGEVDSSLQTRCRCCASRPCGCRRGSL